MKKTNIILGIIILIFGAGLLRGEKVGTLDKVYMPTQLEIAHGQVYCMQEATIFAYDLKDWKFKKEFCKKGQGPGELMVNPGLINFMVPFNESLIAIGVGKAIIYSKDGILNKEFRVPPLAANYLCPLDKDTYLGLKFDTASDPSQPRMMVGIMNDKMEVIKEIYPHKFTGAQNTVNLTADGVNIAVVKDKIIIEQSAEGFVVSIYDFKGKLLKKIKKDKKPIKFTDYHKEIAMNQIKQNPAIKGIGWESFKKIVKFINDDYMPLIRDLQVDQNLIYLMSGNLKEDKQEFVVMDFDGKIVKTAYLPQPIATDFVSVIFGRPTRYYKIYQGKYYYLKENMDEETWELHVENI